MIKQTIFYEYLLKKKILKNNSITLYLYLRNYLKIQIPSFCFNQNLNIAGNCRMCLVEISKSIKPIISCNIMIANNMQFFLKTAKIFKIQETILEFILLNHPLDCPICDQGGFCDLQDNYLLFGKKSSRFFLTKKKIEIKNFNSYIKGIMNRCILCSRCIRFLQKKLKKTTFFGEFGRGKLIEVNSFKQSNFVLTSNSVNLTIIDLCPVGALTLKKQAYTIRPWDLKIKILINFMDIFGSYLYIEYKNKNILRILPLFNILKKNYYLKDIDRLYLINIFLILKKKKFFFILTNFFF